MRWQFHTHIAAEPLKEILVQQASANQSRVKRREVTKVIIVDAEGYARDGLEMDRGIAPGNTRWAASTVGQRRSASSVYLHRVVKGDVTLPREIVFEKYELPGSPPVNGGNRNSSGAIETCAIEPPGRIIHERACNVLIRHIAPGRRIGCGTRKYSGGDVLRGLPSEISAVDRAQTWCLWEKHAAHSDDVRRIRALVREAQMIGSVDEIG